MRCVKLLPLLLLVAGPLQALETQGTESYFPQKLTAQDLLYACAASALTSRGRERQHYCRGFISGVEETIRYYGINGTDKATFCFPQGMTARHYGDVFIRYASRKGIELERPAVVVVREAFAETFACPAPEPQGKSP